MDSLGSDHSMVKLDLSIGIEVSMPTPYKQSASYLKNPYLILKIKGLFTS